MSRLFDENKHNMSLGHKLVQMNWGLLLLISATACVGFGMLYSVADGNVNPWVSRQAIRFGLGVSVLFIVALIDIRFWMRMAYPAYFGALVLLVLVELMGQVGMGAQRWIGFGPLQLQPSELMKITLVMALARYFNSISIEDVSKIRHLLIPVLMCVVPSILVLRQPDLGTTVLLLAGGAAVFFVAGVSWRYFLLAFVGGIAAIPVGWQFLKQYQRERVLTFLDPERDPLGAGYHIMQSKIAFGSGGVSGKGFMQGTQSHLNFLPEKQTDFIFTMLAEEFGLLGSLSVLGLYAVIIIYCYAIALRVRNHFGRLLALGICMTFFLYVMINVAMVTGLVPVVGVPLPLVSYGGSAMLTLLIGFGLIMSAYIHREVEIPRHETGD